MITIPNDVHSSSGKLEPPSLGLGWVALQGTGSIPATTRTCRSGGGNAIFDWNSQERCSDDDDDDDDDDADADDDDEDEDEDDDDG